MRTAVKLGALTLAGALLPTAALAHTGIGDTGGFAHGFWHPIGGLDHVLAMVAVGAFAARLGGRALWIVPTAFVAMMAVGGFMGMEGIQLPFVETGVALSVVVLGVAVALRWKLPVAAAGALVGLFAIFHGHAHGGEMPVDASGLTYATGFMLATALLHVVGIGLGLGVGKIGARSKLILQASGGAMALAGVALLSGYL
ncbi:MAG TPA: HupE/UreJ family protein [Dongiaceae bacterium]|nr:HupE/UreJ family protein [Dongiaceae bacterium]